MDWDLWRWPELCCCCGPSTGVLLVETLRCTCRAWRPSQKPSAATVSSLRPVGPESRTWCPTLWRYCNITCFETSIKLLGYREWPFGLIKPGLLLLQQRLAQGVTPNVYFRAVSQPPLGLMCPGIDIKRQLVTPLVYKDVMNGSGSHSVLTWFPHTPCVPLHFSLLSLPLQTILSLFWMICLWYDLYSSI